MTRIVDGPVVLRNAKRNEYKNWNRSPTSADRSGFSSDASNRIFDSYAAVQPSANAQFLQKDSKIFAMGSCFAREIESALVKRGGSVISVDKTVDRTEFHDNQGRIRDGFFHRFTPRSMYQEFQAAFGEAPSWTADALIFPVGDNSLIDLNYWHIKGADSSPQATATRREIAMALVRRAAEADVIILTLGLNEAWFHQPSDLFANFISPSLLAKRIDEFKLHFIGVQETIACLDGIRSVIQKHHRTGNFRIIVTVSPVPLTSTFSDKDIIVANFDSKSTLRAAAADFAMTHENVTYFPSYEMVSLSDVSLAWRPDRIHVNPGMVKHIVSTFVSAFYEPGALTT